MKSNRESIYTEDKIPRALWLEQIDTMPIFVPAAVAKRETAAEDAFFVPVSCPTECRMTIKRSMRPMWTLHPSRTKLYNLENATATHVESPPAKTIVSHWRILVSLTSPS